MRRPCSDHRVVDHRRELIQLPGAAEDVHVREAPEDRCPLAFRHAADDADHQQRIASLALPQLPEPRPDLLFGMLAY